ncbi:MULTISPECIES: hypothetical protein [Streptomyces]|uniref:Uncharacterized protein n=1 Tax=Streptomyces viridochromogenes TaxID=1938 RepID=A0A0L8J5Y9_STRVR|nr:MULTISPECIES: hypothetical protein [Streptomyces]KOG08939.1 hypothetical protein ADK34_37845 [Streptomyces viridochromogenes]
MTDHPTTEARLRAAFVARASLVTPHDLRPAAPPRGRAWGTRRVYGLVLATLGTAAAAAAAVYFLALTPGTPVHPVPVPPARTPAVGEPRPATPPPGPATPSVTPQAGGPPPESR